MTSDLPDSLFWQHCRNSHGVAIKIDMAQVYSAKAAANFFLSKFRNSGITPLKIQKLVYVAHGWHLAIYDERLVSDEYAEAWEYGPVFPSLYHAFKYRGYLPIYELATKIDIDRNVTTPRIARGDKKTKALLGKIWEIYGDMSGMQLSTLCHQPGSPWALAREASNGRRNTHIEDEEIRKHYFEKLERNRKSGSERT